MAHTYNPHELNIDDNGEYVYELIYGVDEEGEWSGGFFLSLDVAKRVAQEGAGRGKIKWSRGKDCEFYGEYNKQGYCAALAIYRRYVNTE